MLAAVLSNKGKMVRTGKKAFRGGLAASIILYACFTFVVLAGVLIFINYKMYWSAFYDYSNKTCLSSNALAGYVIDGDMVEHFGKTLKVDEEYEAFAARLDGLKERINAKYFYVLVDKGIPDKYVYIYDANHSEQFPGEKYALGATDKKSEFEGAEEVLSSGKGFDKARYYNEPTYGELYYAYSPIFNSKGKVVGFLGTDIDISPLHKEINLYRFIVVSMLLLAIGVFSLIYFIIIRKILTRPMQSITNVANQLSRGELDFGLSPMILDARGEVGQLATAFDSVAKSISGLVLDIENIMKAIRDGKLKERGNLNSYEGDYRYIMDGVNSTLDVVCRHFDAISDGVGFFDRNMQMLYSNLALGKILNLHGISVQNESGKEFFESVLAGTRGEVFCTNGDINSLFFVKRKEPLVCEVSLAVKESEEQRNYVLTLLQVEELHDISILPHSPLPEHEKDSSCIMMLFSDVTTLVRTRDEAKAASRAKSSFLSHMSHEIRTPMNAIIGMTQIAKGTTDREKIDTCLAKIESSCGHLLGIINDILDFSKIEAGKVDLEEQEFSIRANVEFVRSMMLSRAKEKNIELSLHLLGVKNEIIVADSLRLNQVLINLLSNALKFSPPNSKIKVVVENMGPQEGGKNRYLFSVQDSGIGIEKDIASRLFQPFQQADSSTSRLYGGTGLGLVIARSLVEMMGGSINLKSTPGKGSTFYFTILAKSRGEADLADEFAETAGGVGSGNYNFSDKRALVVDDIDINREIVMEMLRPTNINLDFAENGEIAVEMFEHSPEGYYDMIFMDIQMPIMDGYDATRKIRSFNREDSQKVTILAMTANAMKEDLDSAKDAGMDAHIAKPLVFADVLKIVGKMLRRN